MSLAIVLRAGAVEAVVLPEVGGALGEFNYVRPEGKFPLLRPYAPSADSPSGEPPHPNELACYPLIPWSNRIGHGAFEFNGTTHRVAGTDPKERYPLHGDGWKRPWRVVERSEQAVTLAVMGDIEPFAYCGSLEYRLVGSALEVRLSVRNAGPVPLPFGLGLHPWFVRTPDVRITATASGILTVGKDLLPIALDPVPEAVDFNRPRGLPNRLIDNSFTGWNGRARIDWLEAGMALEIGTNPALHFYQVYAPPGRPYFCFEPISHPADAFNFPAPDVRPGLVVLAPEETYAIAVTFGVGQSPP
jgi:aldose 1-epimerase